MDMENICGEEFIGSRIPVTFSDDKGVFINVFKLIKAHSKYSSDLFLCLVHGPDTEAISPGSGYGKRFLFT